MMRKAAERGPGETAGGNGSGEILEILKEEYGFSLIEADSCERARQIFESRADFSCVIVFYDEAEGRRDLSGFTAGNFCEQ